MTIIDTDLLLAAYAQGAFPMGTSRDSDTVEWYRATKRGIIPLDAFHIPRRLQRTLRTTTFTITTDHDFTAVVSACAAPRAEESDTWINAPIINAYNILHQQGHAHSLEVWDGAELVGGIYGVSLGRAFFGESMFSRARDASKIALVHLLLQLQRCGYQLFDTQFLTPHLAQFGALEISAKTYSGLLAAALSGAAAAFPSIAGGTSSAALATLYLQSTTHTS